MSPGPPQRWTRVAVLAALAAVTALAFRGVLANGWVRFDDDGYVYRNTVVSMGVTLRGLLWFLHEPHGANWVPLTAWSHMLDAQLFGLEPAGHHATSLLLHVLNALLVALALHRLTGAWWRSVCVAAFFALHPLRVESVAWIAERKDVLSTCFLLLTLLTYARWAERPGPGRYAMVALAFGLGLMSKPMLITVPFLLVVLDVWPLGRLEARAASAPQVRGRTKGRARESAAGAAAELAAGRAGPRTLTGLIAEKWPLLVMAAAVTVIAYAVQWQSGALHANEWVPLWRRACNAAFSYWRYVALTVWPRDLAVFHAYPANAHPGWATVAALALAAVTLGALALVRRAPWITTGWLWYAGTLVPVSGLVQTGHHAYADRFTYAPGIGLAVAVVWTLATWLERAPAARAVTVAIALAALAACGVATARQVRVWRDTQTLFERVLAVAGDNPLGVKLGHLKIGQGLLENGRTAEAVEHLERGLGLVPGYEDSLRRVLAARADNHETRRGLAATLVRETRVEEGIAEYRALLARDSADADACNNIAWIRATHQVPEHRNGAEAVRMAERARDLCPEPVAVVFSTLAAAYAEAGRYRDAQAAGSQAVSLARAAGSADEADRYARQLRYYRSGRPYHFED